MKNGRCEFHGGKSPAHNAAAVRHGAYASAMSDEDKSFLDSSDRMGQLDDELILLRVRLRRLARLAQEHEDGTLKVDATAPVEVVDEYGTTSGGEGGGGEFTKTRTVKRLPDYHTYIDRYIGRIAVLERLKAELSGTLPTQGGEGTDTTIVKRGGLPTQAELDAEES